MSKESTKEAFLKFLSEQLNSLRIVSDSSAEPLTAPTLINALRELAKGQPVMLLNLSAKEEDSLTASRELERRTPTEQQLKSKTQPSTPTQRQDFI